MRINPRRSVSWKPNLNLRLNRVGEVGETTDAVLYLATAEFTTGQILRVDGGYVTGRA